MYVWGIDFSMFKLNNGGALAYEIFMYNQNYTFHSISEFTNIKWKQQKRYEALVRIKDL